MTQKTRESMFLHRPSSAFVSLFKHDHSWSPGRKWGTTLTVAAFTFISSVSSTTIAPASKQLVERFDIHNTVLLAMTTSVFVLAYGAHPSLAFSRSSSIVCSFRVFVRLVAFGPLFFSPLSEVYGRSPVIQIASLLCLGIRFVHLPDVN